METISFSIPAAQADMRKAYASGATGLLASSLIWLVAGMVAIFLSASEAIIVLLVGGAFIFPGSIVFSKLVGRSGSNDKANPLGPLALEGTIFMLFCIPIAYGVSLYRLEWFFPAMMLIIGGRYLTFATLYGQKLYYLCGGALAAAAWLLFELGASPATGALAGGGIELVFAVILGLLEWQSARLDR